MESNKDEALRCIELANSFITQENYSEAHKFLKKSLNLYPTEQAKALLEKMESKIHSHPTSRPSSSPLPTQSPSSHPSTSQERDYTKEQHEAVLRVKKCKNYYEILEVSKDVTDFELKKQYRKLALLMHPDKNHAPGAEESFKAVSQAFACLSDPEKRRHYDLHGSEAPTQHIHSNRYRTNMGDLTPEELFDMMFGHQFQRHHSHEGRRQRRPQAHFYEADVSSSSFLLGILQLFLVVALLLLFTTGYSYQESSFSLKKIGTYYLERCTERKSVLYYVTDDTENKIHSGAVNLVSLEGEVERTWAAEMERKCAYERQQKSKMERMAQWFEGEQKSAMLKQAQAWKTPSCEALYS